MAINPTSFPRNGPDALPRPPRIVVDRSEVQAAKDAKSERRGRIVKRALISALVGGVALGGVEVYRSYTAPDPPMNVVQEDVSKSKVADLPVTTPPIFSANGQWIGFIVSGGATPRYSVSGQLQGFVNAHGNVSDTITVVDSRSGAPQTSLPTRMPINQMAWVGKSSTFVSLDSQGGLTAYDAAAKKELWSTVLSGAESPSARLSASGDGKFVAVGGYNGSLYVLDAQNGQRVDIQHVGSGVVLPRFLPNNDLAVISNDRLDVSAKYAGDWNRVDVLQSGSWAPGRPMALLPYPSTFLPAISNDGQHVAGARTGSYVYAWDQNVDVAYSSNRNGNLTTSPVYSPDNQRFAFTYQRNSSNNDLHVMQTGSYHDWSIEVGASPFMQFSPDGRTFIVVDQTDRDDGAAARVQTFDAASGDAKLSEQMPGPLQGTPQLSPDGRFMAVLTRRNEAHPTFTLYVVNVTQDRPVMAYPLDVTTPPNFSFTPDGSRLAVISAHPTADSTPGSLYEIQLPTPDGK